ncbi:MAG: DNA (cytosine-5)-methyltransferase 1 [Roseivirga sp.]|jgi:DNA (cytosine-5)-methyltransferase 1
MGKIKFIDLFAGIGGFHQALKKFDSECVFASEIDIEAALVYSKNHDIIPKGDIKKINEKDIPSFDLLCAGFPCQPFSKGGMQVGFEDKTRGTLFFDICRILKHHKPKYVFLENVSNLLSHDGGRTYRVICEELDNLGYILPKRPLQVSPHFIGVPVLRPRVYIPGVRKDLTHRKNLDFDELMKEDKLITKNISIYSIIDKTRKSNHYYISEYEERVLDMWNEFYLSIDLKIIGFPIWFDEFRGEYNFSHLPKWKQGFIKKNRDLYIRNKSFIDSWILKYSNLDWVVKTHKKFEWQAGVDCKNIYECLIQFRPSGVRAKRPDKFSTLVAMNHPQIVGKYKRRLTPNETKRLQSIPEDFELHHKDSIALKQLGNGVNVKVLEKIMEEFLF